MKDDPLIWQLILQFALILVNAVFACAEIAFISINETKITQQAHTGNKKAQRLLNVTRQPARFLATIQVGITLAGFLGSAFAAGNFSGVLTEALIKLGLTLSHTVLNTVSVFIITLVLSFLTLVLGELVPKRVAMKKPEKLAFALLSFIRFVAKVFAPAVFLLTASTNGILRLLHINPEEEESAITKEQIRLLLDLGSVRGTIDKRQNEIIHNVFEFGDKIVSEVMTHRLDTILLMYNESDAVWEQTILNKRHSVYPICGKNQDDILGVLYTRDFLMLHDRSRASVMANAVRQAQFVPKTVKTDVLFNKMKKRRNHFVVVLDEYGAMLGIVTMNDLLEELVGDLEDDDGIPPDLPPIERRGEGEWIINGTVDFDKVIKETGLSLPADKFNTFSSFVFSILGSIPCDGQTPTLKYQNVEISILEIKEHRLERALLKITKEDG
ncbi:hemolysin [Spirochaetia bacterium]|nr:hemolysin [Spirochaetia bacterium]